MFDILVRAMGSGGDLQKIEHKTLPPRKRPGWTGGDDRGPSSKSVSADKGLLEQDSKDAMGDETRTAVDEGELKRVVEDRSAGVNAKRAKAIDGGAEG